MRAQESPSHLAMYQTLGAAARPIAGSEVLPALNTGNVDGFDNTADGGGKDVADRAVRSAM